jgi:hypothetical protein
MRFVAYTLPLEVLQYSLRTMQIRLAVLPISTLPNQVTHQSQAICVETRFTDEHCWPQPLCRWRMLAWWNC